jgi:hypothetical protein
MSEVRGTTVVPCRIDIENFGSPPRRSWLEARREPEGFSVWLWDELRCPDGLEIGRKPGPYDAYAMAHLILDFGVISYLLNGMPFHRIPRDARRCASVTGEAGLRAFVLRCAVITGAQDAWPILTEHSREFAELEQLVKETPPDAWEISFDSLMIDSLEIHDGGLISNFFLFAKLPMKAEHLPEVCRIRYYADRWRQERADKEGPSLHHTSPRSKPSKRCTAISRLARA